MGADAETDGLVGERVERREDSALVRGTAEYTDDKHPTGTAYLAVARSQYGHAEIEAIETDTAESIDGVVAVYTAADIDAAGIPGEVPATSTVVKSGLSGHPLLADDRVYYQGQPIAVVIAESRYAAHDGVQAVDVTYERLDAVTDVRRATGPDAPTLHDPAANNVAAEWELGDCTAVERAFEDVAHEVSIELRNNRLLPTAMEPRAVVGEYAPDSGKLTVTMSSQTPHGHRGHIAEAIDHPEQKLRVIAPDVGGGFGAKGHDYPEEALVAWSAKRLDRPVKWQATRSSDASTTAHARDHDTQAAFALDEQGVVQGLRVTTDANIGGHLLSGSPNIPTSVYGNLLSGQYAIPELHCRVRAVFTNTAPVHAYRGAGRPEAIYVLERLMDRAADELGLDPATIRRRNQVEADAFPYESATGYVYDSGEYERALDRALELVDYEELRARQERLREEGRYLGIGLANYVESAGTKGLFESGQVRVHPSGAVTVFAGTHSHGQGHGTTYAQIVADELGVDYDDIEVIEGDTDRIPEGTGTFGSRSAAVGGSAIVESARTIREKAKQIAADKLEAAATDIVVENGEFQVRGAPNRAVDWATVAGAAHSPGLPDGLEAGLDTTTFYEPENYTFPFGTHVAVVEVDPESGEIEFERYLAVDDVGTRINPTIVEGQIHGGTVQGLGQALYEHAQYDDNGNLITGTLQDYAIPKAEHVPEMDLEAMETPSPHNPLGVKGVGEAGTIAAPPAVVNAVVDALAPFEVDHLDMPLTPERVWRATTDGANPD
ncbi:MAG: xanthine dehydrogenase family protein molybdopterin-binding subunit [Halobacteriales archaeon]